MTLKYPGQNHCLIRGYHMLTKMLLTCDVKDELGEENRQFVLG